MLSLALLELTPAYPLRTYSITVPLVHNAWLSFFLSSDLALDIISTGDGFLDAFFFWLFPPTVSRYLLE